MGKASVVLCLLLVSQPARSVESARQDSSSALRYLALGDSYTIGHSVPDDQRWPVQLAGRLRQHGIAIAAPDILARTGWTSAELLTALQTQSLAPVYDLVTLQIGVNDQFRRQSIETFAGHFRDLLEQAIVLARDDPDAVLVVSIPDWGSTPFAGRFDRPVIGAQIDRFNARAHAISQELGVTLVDITALSKATREDPSLTADDGLHPSAKLYRRWVDVILPVVLQRLWPATAGLSPLAHDGRCDRE